MARQIITNRKAVSNRKPVSNRKIIITNQNLLFQSQTLQNAVWQKIGPTMVDNAAMAPDGTMTASAFTFNTDASPQTYRVGQTDFPINTPTTISIFAKAGSARWLVMTPNNSVSYAFYDLVGGAIGNVSNGNPAIGNLLGQTITPIPAYPGWYRITITVSMIPSGGYNLIIFAASSNGSFTYQGDGSIGYYLWQGQQVAANWAGPIVKTTSSLINTGNIRNIP